MTDSNRWERDCTKLNCEDDKTVPVVQSINSLSQSHILTTTVQVSSNTLPNC